MNPQVKLVVMTHLFRVGGREENREERGRKRERGVGATRGETT